MDSVLHFKRWKWVGEAYEILKVRWHLQEGLQWLIFFPWEHFSIKKRKGVHASCTPVGWDRSVWHFLWLRKSWLNTGMLKCTCPSTWAQTVICAFSWSTRWQMGYPESSWLGDSSNLDFKQCFVVRTFHVTIILVLLEERHMCQSA